MPHEMTSPLPLLRGLFGARPPSGRWVYVAAALPPVLGVVDWLRGPYHFSVATHGPALGLLLLCFVQYLRPTVAGWFSLLVAYAWTSIAIVANVVVALQDIGSPDHSRFEGWNQELLYLGMAGLALLLCVLIARRFPGPRLQAVRAGDAVKGRATTGPGA